MKVIQMVGFGSFSVTMAALGVYRFFVRPDFVGQTVPWWTASAVCLFLASLFGFLAWYVAKTEN